MQQRHAHAAARRSDSSAPPFGSRRPSTCAVPLACRSVSCPVMCSCSSVATPFCRLDPQRLRRLQLDALQLSHRTGSNSAVPVSAFGVFSGPLTVTAPRSPRSPSALSGANDRQRLRQCPAPKRQLRLRLVVAHQRRLPVASSVRARPASSAACRYTILPSLCTSAVNCPSGLPFIGHVRQLQVRLQPRLRHRPFASAIRLSAPSAGSSPSAPCRTSTAAGCRPAICAWRCFARQVVAAIARDLHPMQLQRNSCSPRYPAPAPSGPRSPTRTPRHTPRRSSATPSRRRSGSSTSPSHAPFTSDRSRHRNLSCCPAICSTSATCAFASCTFASTVMPLSHT